MIRAGLPPVIVQPGVNYGPGDTSEIRPTFVRYLQGKLRAIPKRTAYCWAHVEDTARAHILAMERGRAGETYIIAAPLNTLIDAVEVAERITGIPAPWFHASPGFLRAIVALSRSERLRDLAGVTYLGNNQKARRELGFDPRPLDDGLRETLQHEIRLLGIHSAASRARCVRNSSNKRCAFPAQFSGGDDIPHNEGQSTLFFGPWYRKSPFFEATQRAGAKAYDIYNHMYLPGLYTDPFEEYWHLINHVTLWDVSVERQVEISGKDGAKFAELITPRDLTKCDVGQGKYVVITDENGGIINDPVLI